MKATGVIVEYNPFHNGHKLHISAAKSLTNADLIIAVMSGNFLQRGEPAFIDKWTRANTALLNGVDLVFELPYAFATAHAPQFAKGAVQLLEAARCDAFCFGSEEGNLSSFQNSLDLLEQVAETHEITIQDAVRRGISYPKALNEAYQAAILMTDQIKPYADLTQPNNILGFHYMQAARHIDSNMAATTIQRVGAHYHDDTISGNAIASATGIRKNFFTTQGFEETKVFYPQATYDALKNWQSLEHSFGSWEAFYPLLRLIILRDGPERLNEIADLTEGIENLIHRSALANETFSGFIRQVKSKRYTWTRIQRMLTHIFTGYTYKMRNQIESPSYLRLLGMTQNGRKYLNQNKKHFDLPLISKASAHTDPSLTVDIHASNMYALGIANGNKQPKLGKDYTQSPIFIRS